MPESNFEQEYAKALGGATAKGTLEIAKAALLPPAQELRKAWLILCILFYRPSTFQSNECG